MFPVHIFISIQSNVNLLSLMQKSQINSKKNQIVAKNVQKHEKINLRLCSVLHKIKSTDATDADNIFERDIPERMSR